MLSKNILLTCALALSSFASAAPSVTVAPRALVLEERTTKKVDTNNGTTTITLDVDLSGLSATKRDTADAVTSVVTYVVDKAIALVQAMIDSDVNRRMYFAQQVVGSVSIQFPGKNVVMSNVGYGFTGTALAITRAVYDAKVGANVDYDVLVFDAGNTFTLEGDGGFQNWCYSIKDACVVSGGGAILSC